jgi:hypothetical protein
MNTWISLTALWKTVVFGLVAGAGLPALFAVGLFALSRGPRLQTAAAGGEGGSGDDTVAGGSTAGLVAAVICFLIVAAAIGWGIYEIYVTGHPAKK